MAEEKTTTDATFWDYKDVKSIIFDLFVGNEDDNFRTLSCIKCSHFSGVDASECDSCCEYTCQDCKEGDADQAKCSGCQSQFKAKANAKKHRLIKNIIDKAMFKCPYKCSEEKIPLSDLVSHIQTTCEIAVSDCSNKCGEKVHATKVAEHNDQVCKNVAVGCDACEKSDVLRHQAEAHKGSEECKNKIAEKAAEVKAAEEKKAAEELKAAEEKKAAEEDDKRNCCPLCKAQASPPHSLEQCILSLANRLETLTIENKEQKKTINALKSRSCQHTAKTDSTETELKEDDDAEAQIETVQIVTGPPEQDQDADFMSQSPDEKKPTTKDEKKGSKMLQAIGSQLGSQMFGNQKHNQSVTQSAWSRMTRSRTNEVKLQKTKFGNLHKLEICGKKAHPAGGKEFCTIEDFDPKKLVQMGSMPMNRCEVMIYEHIGAIRLTREGENTQKGDNDWSGEGAKKMLHCTLEIPDEVVTTITIRHDAKLDEIQNITFETSMGTEIAFNGSNNTGIEKEFQLDDGEIIVGCYGFTQEEEDRDVICSLGFITWRPSDDTPHDAEHQDKAVVEQQESAKNEKKQVSFQADQAQDTAAAANQRDTAM